QAATDRLEPRQDVAVDEGQHEYGMADDDRHQRALEIDLAEKDQQRQAGQDRRHQEGQVDDNLQQIAPAPAPAVIVQGEQRAEHERQGHSGEADDKGVRQRVDDALVVDELAVGGE